MCFDVELFQVAPHTKFLALISTWVWLAWVGGPRLRMYSQGSQCSVSAPKIGHLLIATLLGYDLKMKIIIAFDYSLVRKKKSTNWLCSLQSGVSIIIINIKTFQKQLATRKMRYIVLLMAPFKKKKFLIFKKCYVLFKPFTECLLCLGSL